MKTILHMLATLCAVGLLSGGSLALVNGWADPLILANEYREKMAAVMEVVPGGKTSQTLEELHPGHPDVDAYLVMDEAGTALGWALLGEGNGFQDKIRLMVGLSPDLAETRGLKILKDTETPGLGTKIREGLFPRQFYSVSEGYLQLDPALKSVKGARAAGNEVQSITGATISSKAVVAIVNEAVNRLQQAIDGSAGSKLEVAVR